MPFYRGTRTEEEDKDYVAPQIGSQPAQIGADTGLPTSTPTKEGSGLANPVRKYIEANRSNVNTLGQAVAGQAMEKAQDLGNQFETKRSALEGQYSNRLGEIGQARQSGEGLIQRAGTESLTPEKVKGFRDTLSDARNYAGVDELKLEEPEYKLKRLKEQSKVDTSEASRANLLKSTFGGGTTPYTRGQRTLDQSILQSSPQALENISRQIQGKVGETEGILGKIKTDVAQQRANVVSQAQALPGSLQEKLNQALTGVQTDVLGRAKETDVKMRDIASRLNSQLSQGYITDEVYNSLDPASRTQIDALLNQGVKFSGKNVAVDPRYLLGKSSFDTAATNEQLLNELDLAEQLRMATPEQLARQRALEQLKASGQTFLAGNETGNAGFNIRELGAMDTIAANRTIDDLLRERAIEDAKGLGNIAYEDYGRHVGAGFDQNVAEDFKNRYGSREDEIIVKSLLSGAGQGSFSGGNMLDRFRSQYQTKLDALNQLRNQLQAERFKKLSSDPYSKPLNEDMPNPSGGPSFSLK